MKRVLCLAIAVSSLAIGVACRRETPPEPVAPMEAEPTELVPTPAIRSFDNLELRLSADDLPVPFAVEVSEGSTLVLRTDLDGVAVVVDAHGDLGPDQLKALAMRQSARIERMNRGRVRGTDEGSGPLGPLVWVDAEYVEDDAPLAITVLVTQHPGGDGLISLWYTHPPGEGDSRRGQLLDLLPHLKAR